MVSEVVQDVAVVAMSWSQIYGVGFDDGQTSVDEALEKVVRRIETMVPDSRWSPPQLAELAREQSKIISIIRQARTYGASFDAIRRMLNRRHQNFTG